MCQISIFFLGVVSEIQRSKFFPTWLPHHVTYDITIMIKTFHISRCSYGEIFLSIRQAVAEKNPSGLRAASTVSLAIGHNPGWVATPTQDTKKLALILLTSEG